MLEVVEQLKDKYQIITFEQRGVGLSKCHKCSFTMNDYISDIDAISKKLNIKQFHLFGHSWGGLYAQIYAKERPEKSKVYF
jgi:proline iminopeptidase